MEGFWVLPLECILGYLRFKFIQAFVWVLIGKNRLFVFFFFKNNYFFSKREVLFINFMENLQTIFLGF